MQSGWTKTTDLLLLIGSNPLPNYVTAKCFLEACPGLKTIWLVASEQNLMQAGTSGLAENLDRVLRNAPGEKGNLISSVETIYISLSDVGNPAEIAREVQQSLYREWGKNRPPTFHLNYTGGTKAMSLHVYRELDNDDARRDPTRFSYLDGRNFRIIDDAGNLIASDLKKRTHITQDQLFSLHGFDKISGKQFANTAEAFDNMLFLTAIEHFAAMITDGTLSRYYDPDGGYDRKYFLNGMGNLATRYGELQPELIKDFRAKGALMDINNAMPEEYRLFDSTGKIQRISNNNFKIAIRFLDGIWLEFYIEWCLRQHLSGTAAIQAMGRGIELRKPGWPPNSCFEIDLLVLDGYQLNGISITTDSNKGLCKSKAFEVVHRTRQIGGDEARAVLITSLNESHKSALQKEIQYETGQPKNHLLVLGESDLNCKTLVAQLETFMFKS